MNRALVVGIVMACLLGLSFPGGVASVPAELGPGASADGTEPTVQERGVPPGLGQVDSEEDFDRVKFRIVVHDNGTAEWTFRYVRPALNESQQEQFRSFAEEFDENSPLYTDFRNQTTALVANGEAQTGREMAATNFEYGAGIEESLPNNRDGVVEMSFHWENFTRQDGQRVIVDDVFEGGLFVPENQTLVVESGDGLEFADVDPLGGGELNNETIEDSHTVTWTGPQEFTDMRPRVEFRPPGSDVESTVDLDGEDGEFDEEEDDPASPAPDTAGASEDNDPWMLLAGVVVLLLGIGSAVAWRHDGAIVARSESEGAETAEASADSASASDEEADEDTAVPDEELLTDEDRVKRLLEENGGRMKQVNIVEETGWSKSKVSMLLSDMEEDGEISKLRVGRENIISLDGHEPEAAGSPFDDED